MGRRFFAAIILGSALGAAAFAEEKPLTFVVLDPLALKNACPCVLGHAQRDYETFSKRLAAAFGRPVEVRYGSAVPDKDKPFELIIGKQSVIEKQAAAVGLKLKMAARLTDKRGSTFFHGVFVVRSNDTAKALADLKGRTVVFGPEDCAEKNSAAIEALKQAGVTTPANLMTRETCAQAGVAVAEFKADAAVISSYALPLLEGCKEITKGELKVIGRTADVPFITIYVSDRFPDALRPALDRALLAVAKDEAFRDAMESADGFQLVPTATTDSWPDWRGVDRACQSSGVPAHLPATPHFLWRKKLSSQSLGGVSATKSIVLVSDKSDDLCKDIWRCLDAETGEQKWEFSNIATGKLDFTNAPRATPVISGDSVFLLGAFGHFHCVSLRDGSVKWQHNLRKEFHGELPTWGFCATPLVAGDRVIVSAVALDAMLVAYDCRTGALLWKTPGGRPGYGNFIRRENQVIGFDAANAGGWDIATGKRLWSLRPPEKKEEFNVPTPALAGGRLLLTTEQNGSRLYAFDSAGRPGPRPVAHNIEANPQVTSPAVADNCIWTTSDEQGLMCLDEQLRIIWQQKSAPFNDAASIIAGNHRVLIVTKNGTLGLLPARPDAGTKPELLALFPASQEVEVWSQPALVGNRLFVRTESEIACLALAE